MVSDKLNEKEQAILDYINIYGLLLCNENKDLPSIFDVGGDWDSVTALIEKREVFYSKVYRKRTSYLSRELYFLLKGFRQSMLGIPAASMDIYNFLYDNGPADTETIKNILLLSKKGYDAAFDILLERMLVTAIKRGKTLGKTWSTFIWGTYADWEKGEWPVSIDAEGYNRISEILTPNLPEKEIMKIIG